LRAVLSRPASNWHREASVHDLSLGGAGLTLPEALPQGERVTVSFLAPSLWDPLALPARVVWFSPATSGGQARAGLAFEPKEPLGVFALFELVSSLP
jgi:PilZ domain